MKPNQIFAAMEAERCEQILEAIRAESADTAKQVVASAAIALKFRPQYLMKQPPAKRAASVRRALAQVSSGALAEELLAVYFLKCRLELLTEWLDMVGLEHEDGMLTDEVVESPPAAEIEKHVTAFRGKDEDPDRELLLRTFSAQPAVEWPALDALVESAA